MSIEHVGVGSPEKEPKIIIAQCEKSFQDWLKNEPKEAEKIKSEILNITGQSEVELSDDDMAIIKIPTDELSIFGTFCGAKGNKAFSENVLNFLKNKAVKFVVAVSDKDAPKITTMIMKINQKDGKVLSKMINKNHGSLRCDITAIEGWSVFESE